MRTTLLFTALTAWTAAQTLSDLPACSLSCLASAIGGLGCSLTDFTCSCKKAEQLTPVVTPCVQSACTAPADQEKTLQVLSGICAAAGFPIEAPAPPAPSAANKSTPAPSEALVYSAHPTANATASEYPASPPVTGDVSNLPSSYSDLIPLPSFVDTIIVSRPSPRPTSVPGVLPPYPTGTRAPSVPAPSGTGAPSTTSSHLPEFTGGAAAVRAPVMAAGVFGLAAFVL